MDEEQIFIIKDNKVYTKDFICLGRAITHNSNNDTEELYTFLEIINILSTDNLDNEEQHASSDISEWNYVFDKTDKLIKRYKKSDNSNKDLSIIINLNEENISEKVWKIYKKEVVDVEFKADYINISGFIPYVTGSPITWVPGSIPPISGSITINTNPSFQSFIHYGT